METFLIRALQLILSLSILVVLHEFGHFAFARLFKVRVEKFYMFFNPNFSLIRAKKINGHWDIKLFSKNIPANERPKMDADGDVMHDSKGKPILEQIPEADLPEGDWRKYPDNTEWGIGWLPLGGYCKISGMVDETTDVTQLNDEPQVWEYRSRSVWQRLPIIIGGVLVNFILAMVIYAAVLFTWGQDYLPLKNAKYGLHFAPIMLENGFRNGDNIEKIDGKPVEQYSEVIEKILFDAKRNILVSRDGKLTEFTLPEDMAQKVLAAHQTELVSIRIPFVISEVTAGSPAEKAKLQAGDSIIGVNGKPLFIFQDIAAELDASRNTEVNLSYVRKGAVMQTKVQLDETAKLGVMKEISTKILPVKHTSYGFLASVPAGINLGWETLTSYVKQFKLVFTKEGSKQLGGFGSIGKMFPKTWDWESFWRLTALLSVILAFMNFLPIPALDGGYVLFLIYEMITKKKPNERFLEYAQTVGMMLLFGLLLYANGNDLFKAIFR
ncbi:MAG: RIP metalloprotease RseP [Paludibacter sp.]|nr:RIP metalloprotease RseP [Paludibacter sp.]